MKVLHATYGNPLIELSKAQRLIGIDAVSCHVRPNKFNFKPDINLNFSPDPDEYKKQVLQFLEEAITQYDIFHFHFGETFLPDKSDLKLLKDAGKKLIVSHNGSEVRMLSKARKLNPYVMVKPKWTEKRIIENLKKLSQYIDCAVVKDHELAAYIKRFYKQVHVIRQPLDVREYTPDYPDGKGKPLIIHAPTKRGLKGTEYVLQAVKQAEKAGYDFDFELLENKSHDETLALFSSADIIIDQLRIGELGRISLEAMAYGKPVICYIRPDLQKKKPENFPVISANIHTIIPILQNLLSKPETWKDLGISGRTYMKKFHNPEKIAQKYVPLYEEL